MGGAVEGDEEFDALGIGEGAAIGGGDSPGGVVAGKGDALGHAGGGDDEVGGGLAGNGLGGCGLGGCGDWEGGEDSKEAAESEAGEEAGDEHKFV